MLEAQDGVITRAQALAGGLGPDAWDRRCRGASGWRQVAPGVCVVGDAGLLQRARAAVLAIGDVSLLSGLTCLVLAGLKLDPPRRVLVLSMHERVLVPPPGVRPVRVRELHRVARHPVRQPPQVTAARAAIDAATYEAVSDRQAMFFLVRAVQDGLVTPQQLRDEARTRARLRRGTAIRPHIDEMCDGVRSLRERDLLQALDRRGIRRPDRLQKKVDAAGRRWLDGVWEPERVIVEVQGPQHYDPDATGAELLRVSALSVPGDRALIQVPSWLLPHDAGAFLDLIAAALAAGTNRAAA